MNTRSRILIVVTAAAVAGLSFQLLAGVADEQARTGDIVTIAGILVVGAAIVLGVLLPWASRSPERAAPIGLVTALAGLLGMPVLLWSGSAMLLGGAGAVIGSHGRTAGKRPASRMSTIATVVGWLAFVVNAALMVWITVTNFA